MRRRGALLLVLLLAAGCREEPPIPDHDAWISITAGAKEVDLGRAFPLTVVRVWREDLAPEDFPDDALAPLEVRLVETTRHADARHVEETRRYDAYAFTLGDVTIAAPTFAARPRGGGAGSEATGVALHLRVRRALDPASPGPAELPGDLLAAPTRWLLPVAVGAAALLGAAILVLARRRARRRRASSVPTPEAPLPPEAERPGPHVRALERIAGLRRAEPRSAEEIQAWHREATGLVRDYVGERFAVRTRERSTDEILADPTLVGACAPEPRRVLAGFLRDCDLVKFAAWPSSAPDRDRLLGAATGFVTATADGTAPAGGKGGAR